MSSLQTSDIPYQYPPLPRNSIRLLTLLPGAPDTDIHITVTPTPLPATTPYEALSYEWGLPSSVHVPSYHDSRSNSLWQLDVTIQLQAQIYCHGNAVVITSNLATILEQLRHRTRPRVLWIDGVCINQQDVDERREQVLLMRMVYEQASRVVMWIGDSKPGTGKVFEIVRHLAAAYDGRRVDAGTAKKKGYLGEIVIDERVLEELKGEAWRDVTDVFTRPYFGRVWVVQEVVMATSAEVMCGKYSVPWHDVYKAMTVIFVLGLVVDKDPHQLPPEARVRDSHAVVQLKSAREEEHSHNRRLWGRMDSIGQVWNARHGQLHDMRKYTYSLATLANLFLGHEVTDARDRIYGMLGMANPEGQYGRENPIQPDYTKKVEEVYRDACQWSILDSVSLRMLDLCDAPATNKLKDLPSWVPDLTGGARRCRLITDITKEEEADSGPLFRPLSSYFADQFRVSFHGNVLRAKGTIIDTVKAATLPCTSMIRHLITMEAFQNFCLDIEPYPTGGTRLDAVWRTFLTNYIPTGPTTGEIKKAPATFGGHYIANMAGNFRYQLGLPDQLTGDMPDIDKLYERGNWTLRRMYPDDVAANISILALMAKHPFVRYLYDHKGDGDSEAWEADFKRMEHVAYGDEGRQFVVTDKGFMGLGPRCPPLGYEGDQFVLRKGGYIWKGDSVAVLAGSDKVWWLRRDGNAGGHRILGHGYMYGVTEGRWFDGRVPVMEDIDIT